MKNWVKKNLAILSLAMSGVEKSTLGQKSNDTTNGVSHVQNVNQGQLADSLVKGEVSQEVMDLRWRTYKILNETHSHSSKIIGYDKSGYPITETKKNDLKKALKKVKVDEEDGYDLEMVVNNDPISVSVFDVMDNSFFKSEIEPIITVDEKLKEQVASHGTISGEQFFSVFKPEKPISVDRDYFPRFMIENYTTKLNVRGNANGDKLLEFYILDKPLSENKNERLFINQLKKATENINSVNFLDISNVNFVTYKSLGVNDFLYFEYDNIEFYKITKINNFYVLKYKTNVVSDGVSILEKYRVEELDKKYENKERKV